MAKKLYSILMMVMLAVLCIVTISSCDKYESTGIINGVQLTGTNWYNNDYSLTFTSNTEALLKYRSGGSDTYYVAPGSMYPVYGTDFMLLTGGKNGYAEWWGWVIDENTIKMSSPTGANKMNLYKSNDE